MVARRLFSVILGLLVCLTSLQAQFYYDPGQLSELKPLWPAEVSLFGPATLVTDTYQFNVPAHSKAHVLEISGKFITIQIRKGRATIPLEDTDFLWQLESAIDQMMKNERALSDSYFSPPAATAGGTEAREDSQEILLQGVIYLRLGKKIEEVLREERELSVSSSVARSTNTTGSVEGNSSDDLSRALSPAVMNKMFGLPIWTEKSPWTEPVADLAHRLDWPKGSSGIGEEIYRDYPQGGREVLGVKPFCLTLHAVGGKAREFVIVYTNQFDPASFHASLISFPELQPDTRAEPDLNLIRAVNNDAWAVSLALTKMLGMPRTKFCGDDQNPGDLVRRWDWGGCAFFLVMAPGKYAVLRVVPAEDYDETGQRILARASELPAAPAHTVEHRDNGDIVVQGVPMVNQGHIEFCGPATWERYLRFEGMPADMYLLGIGGHAGVGGSLMLSNLEQAVRDLTSRYGRNIETVSPELTLPNLASYLDAGIPLIWACNNPPSLEKQITERSIRRKNFDNWAEYKKESLDFQQQNSHDVPPGHAQSASPYSHLRLIIGYNPETREIAISDSYGDWAQERWMTLLEANAVSLGYIRAMR